VKPTAKPAPLAKPVPPAKPVAPSAARPTAAVGARGEDDKIKSVFSTTRVVPPAHEPVKPKAVAKAKPR